MALLMPQTPQRPMPGRYMNTPAAAAHAQPSVQRFPDQSSSLAPTSSAPISAPTLSLVERAAKSINDKLEEEGRFPPIDNYLTQGTSADYDIPTSAAWAPFQQVRHHAIPEDIFDQYNRAQMRTNMGLFGEIHHAWVSIDSSLYLWDYTRPSPELLGYEDAGSSINAVRLVKPRPGVFVAAIKYLLVVATAADVHLIGIAETAQGPDMPSSLTLYQTKMLVPTRGLGVQCLAGSAKSGRIFFAGGNDPDVHEFTYQQEEKWFQNRCTNVNRTRKGLESFNPMLSVFSSRAPAEHLVQMEVDDSRNTLYTLSSRSTISAYHLRSSTELNQTLTRALPQILGDVQHKTSGMDSLPSDCRLVSISAVSSRESARICLVATTDMGCRIYFSGLSGYSIPDASGGVTSLQVHHVKFPPREAAPPAGGAFPTQPPNAASQVLKATRQGLRYPPGYFLCVVQKNSKGLEALFLSAPDSGRIAHPQDASQANKFPEYGMWAPMSGQMQDSGITSEPFSASAGPHGFGNELAVQYDKPTSEIAVLTNSGVYTFRRRRMVDIFAAAVRTGGGDDGLDGEIRNFANRYGRGETIATALAVACGQASEVTLDHRVLRITDNEILEFARRTFIEHGGRPEPDQNIIPASDTPSIDQVKPSPRHEGLALYIARLLRSVWKANIAIEDKTPAGALAVKPTVSLEKLHSIQRDLIRLQEFLSTNKTFIEGLAGPDALGRAMSKQDEVALQAEHRALSSIVRLIADVIEGIAFVLVLFAPEERVDEIVMALSPPSREALRSMTFERLFSMSEGKNLAKELVKSIVNRNIAAGSNVDTVTDALRRRCGSFCSADDCVVFKAQEQLKRAADVSASSDASRAMLNEGLRLLLKVAGSLSSDQLNWAVEQFISMQFFAGAVQLCLGVAQESDRGNQGAAWFRDGMPVGDPREKSYESRQKCYTFIHNIVTALDASTATSPELVDGQLTVAARRRREAYDVIDSSQDELFQVNLFDWYVHQGWSDRLLEIHSPAVVSYLEHKSKEDLGAADLLWRYHAHYNDFVEAARVQLDLAKSPFALSLEQRVQYASFAKTNASAKGMGISEISRNRRSRQELLKEASDLLDLANIQSDTLQRLRGDERIPVENRSRITPELGGRILSIDELYNGFVDPAAYYDITLLIYQVADHRNPSAISTTWVNLIQETNDKAEASASGGRPYEVVADKIRWLGSRLSLSETLFPIHMLVTLLERYVLDHQKQSIPSGWVPALLLSTDVPVESVTRALESVWYGQELPFKGKQRRGVTADLLWTLERWCEMTSAGGGQHVFGGPENAIGVQGLVEQIKAGEQGASGDSVLVQRAMTLGLRIAGLIR